MEKHQILLSLGFSEAYLTVLEDLANIDEIVDLGNSAISLDDESIQVADSSFLVIEESNCSLQTKLIYR